MAKALLIVDPQYDFISGTLPVPGAAEAMDALARYILDSDGRYALKMITADWHPYRHFSFVPCGGIWPRHCVQYSQGAAVYQAVLDAADATSGVTVVLTKGTEVDREEYSVFQNADSASHIAALLAEYKIDRIDICGIAGDICVYNSLCDGRELYGHDMFNVLPEFSPSLDGGEKLRAVTKNNK